MKTINFLPMVLWQNGLAVVFFFAEYTRTADLPTPPFVCRLFFPISEALVDAPRPSLICALLSAVSTSPVSRYMHASRSLDIKLRFRPCGIVKRIAQLMLSARTARELRENCDVPSPDFGDTLLQGDDYGCGNNSRSAYRRNLYLA